MAFGIVCEYNPFHNGHLRQIQEIKKESNEPIICVMSGNFTQRGEISVADKYARAKTALECGADVVLELPVPFCVASAEYFASFAVQILAGVFVNKLSFGSESANAEQIVKIAQIAASEEFKSECANLSKNQGSVGAYFNLLAEKSGVDGIKSNDILGIEYTKAIIKNGYNMQICPIKREGSAYRDTELSLGELPSASAIRESLFKGDFDKISGFVPAPTMKMLTESELADFEKIKDGILLSLRLMDAEKIDASISDKGLVNRILSTAQECTTFDEFEEKLQTKKYTKSAIRRAIFYILLGIKQEDFELLPQYTVLLGATEKGREYLASIRKNEGAIKVITKPSEAEGTRLFELSKRADALYTMCFENKKESGFYIKKSPVIL
jgi:predicted nucleotidyltransferase